MAMAKVTSDSLFVLFYGYFRGCCCVCFLLAEILYIQFTVAHYGAVVRALLTSPISSQIWPTLDLVGSAGGGLLINAGKKVFYDYTISVFM